LQRGTNSKDISISWLKLYFLKRIHAAAGHHQIEFNLHGLLQALTIDTSSGIKVKGLTIRNSQQMHFVISKCDSVRVSGVLVSAPGDSPNTDGIHITESTNVVLQDCKIGTGSQILSISFLFKRP
jgi:polygalacturonase